MRDFTGLSSDMCWEAFKIIFPTVNQAMENGVVKRPQGFFVVLDPVAPSFTDVEKQARPAWFEEEIVLFTKQIGEAKEWDRPFDEIAFSKAYISWKTGLSSRQVQLEAPYLYAPHMTKYGGSAVGPGGLVVAFSGVEEWFDQMFSEILLAAIKGVCLHEMHKPDGVMANAKAFIGG